MVEKEEDDGEWVESWVFKDGDWIRDDQWMTKAQLQGYADEFETNEAIRKGTRRKQSD